MGAQGLCAELVWRDDRQREAVLVGALHPGADHHCRQGLGLGVGVARHHDRLDHRVPAQERARGRDHICGGVQQCGGRTGRDLGAGLHGADQRLGVDGVGGLGVRALQQAWQRRGALGEEGLDPPAAVHAHRPCPLHPLDHLLTHQQVHQLHAGGPKLAEVQPGGAVALLGAGFDHRPQGADPFADRLQACTGQRLVGRREGIAGQGRKARPGHPLGEDGQARKRQLRPADPCFRGPDPVPGDPTRARATRRRAQAKRPRARATRRHAREGTGPDGFGPTTVCGALFRPGPLPTHAGSSCARSAVGEACSAPRATSCSPG